MRIEHDKISFAKEYCLCRRIPYYFHGEHLSIGDKQYGYRSIFSVFNLPYKELIETIDKCALELGIEPF